MTGQAQAAAAAEHIKQAVNRLATLVMSLEELARAAGSIDKDADSAAAHLESVADLVGSATARELAGIVRAALEDIQQTFNPNVSETLQMCRDEAERLSSVFTRAEKLSQQLGE